MRPGAGAALAAPQRGSRELVRGALIAAGAVALAAAVTRWASPLLLVGAGLAAAVLALAVRFARRHGSLAAWIALLSLSILAGELSAVSLGGQSGRLLWADLVLGVGLGWALLGRGFRVEVPRAPFLIAMIPLLAWSALSLLVSPDPLTGIAELKEWCVALLAAAAAACFATDSARARLLLGTIAVTGSLVALHMTCVAFTSPLGPALAVLLKQVDLPWGRTNYLAGLLAIGFPVALGLLGHASRWRGRALWLVVLALNALGIVLSASKGAIVALVTALVLSFAPGSRAGRAGAAVTAAILGIGVAIFEFGPLRQVLLYRLQASAVEYSVGARIDLYTLAWETFCRNPLLGVGLNNFSVISHRLTGVDTVPHNFELGFLSELGLPGALLAILWAGTLGVTAWRARCAARSSRERALGLGVWAAFVGFAIHNQFESTLYGEQFKIVLMLLSAATWRLSLAAAPPEPAAH